MKREEEAKIYCYSCIERIRGFGCRKYCLNYQRKLIGKEILSLWTEKITNAEKYEEEIEKIGEEDLAVVKATGKPVDGINNDGLSCVNCLFECGKKNHSEEVEKWLAQEAK